MSCITRSKIAASTPSFMHIRLADTALPTRCAYATSTGAGSNGLTCTCPIVEARFSEFQLDCRHTVSNFSVNRSTRQTFKASGRLTVHRISGTGQHDHVVAGREPWEYNLTMKHSDFIIGRSFWCGGREWRCTDIGTRTIVAICLDETEVVTSSQDPAVEDTRRTLSQSEAAADGWFNGPPYAVAEPVFDEYDQHPCALDAEGTGEGDGGTPAGMMVRGPYSEARKILRVRRDAARALEAASPAKDLTDRK